eukprot:GHUV01055475.1.p1 GENE.GHUV01055475.1~~GHUV01055475.1.p1  ORF type:complete len:109 (-),score=10.38 GHUV01055475.1:17-343(-)
MQSGTLWHCTIFSMGARARSANGGASHRYATYMWQAMVVSDICLALAEKRTFADLRRGSDSHAVAWSMDCHGSNIAPGINSLYVTTLTPYVRVCTDQQVYLDDRTGSM